MVAGNPTEVGAGGRRTLKVGLGVGYTAAARLVILNTASKTSDKGLRSGQISFDQCIQNACFVCAGTMQLQDACDPGGPNNFRCACVTY